MEKNKVFMIVVIVLMVVLLGAIGFLGFTLAKYMSNQNEERPQIERVAVVAPEDLELISLEKPIVSNLKIGEDGLEHINQVTIDIGVNKKDTKKSPVLIAELQNKQAILRDICGTIIRGKTYEDLRREDGKEALKQEILERVQNEFESSLVYAVYISDWYLE